jgi:dimethylargininase
MAECLVTFVERSAIDYGRALRQHAAYCDALRACSVEVRTLDCNGDQPDCTFIEDTAVILDEVAVIGRPGTAARREETPAIEAELRALRPVESIAAPGTLEGGDVLRVGRTLLVGLSSRTNAAGAAALDGIAHRFGYSVRTVPVHGCLHLKTACTALPDGCLLVNPDWIDVERLRDFEPVTIPIDEPFGANIACLGDRVLAAAEHERTADLIRGLGFELGTVELDEFAKAEGGVTCLSLFVG